MAEREIELLDLVKRARAWASTSKAFRGERGWDTRDEDKWLTEAESVINGQAIAASIPSADPPSWALDQAACRHGYHGFNDPALREGSREWQEIRGMAASASNALPIRPDARGTQCAICRNWYETTSAGYCATCIKSFKAPSVNPSQPHE